MSKKIKNLCLSLAMVAVVGVSAAASACTIKSDHPEAKITISFNEKTYTIEYTLYRNMYPQTVQHFIELADEGFYDNIIIHDYKSSDWVTGAYSYDSGDTTGYKAMYTNAMSEYLETHCKEKAYYDLMTAGIESGKFSASVYSREVYDDKGNPIVAKADALPTLIGEFSDNGHKIEGNKGLTSSYGTLKMVYYKKDGNQIVTLNNSFNQILYGNYSNNCATSLFSMQVGSSSLYDASKYCVFGQFKNDKSKSALEDLTDDINDYSDSLGSSSTLTKTVSTHVDKEDKFADEGGKEIDTSFTMISMPIIITKVEITKY